MSDFQRALQNYQNQQQSVAQQTLQENDSLKQSRAQGIQAQGATLTGKTSALFNDKIGEEARKIQDELGIDLSLGSVVPGALKLGSRLASLRQSALNSRWKDVNAQRFNERENAAQNESDETGIGDKPEEITETEMLPKQQPPTQSIEEPSEMPPTETETSFMSETPREIAPESGRTQLSQRTQEFDESDDPFQPTAGARVRPTEFTPREPTQPDIKEPDVEPDTSGLESEETGLETTAEDLAPEITSAAETAGSISSALGDAIPVVGGILGLAGLISGSVGLAETIKDASSDPYASIRGKLGQYQKQITGLQNQVSADQFQEKLGSGTPQFGSLAVPQMDTAKMSNIALHS